MTQVFFYHGASDKVAASCALLSGAYAQRKPVLIYTRDPATASLLDRALWTHSALSFIPHCRAAAPIAAETLLLITDTLDTLPQTERLMNLGNDIPPGFAQFQSLIEVVGQDPEDREIARERVRFYKEQGHEVRYFDLSNR